MDGIVLKVNLSTRFLVSIHVGRLITCVAISNTCSRMDLIQKRLN
jgi:hypothetical protein